MFLLKKILAALILPPTGPVLLALFGLWLSRRKSRRWQYAGLMLVVTSLLSLVGLSMPVVGNALMAPLEIYPPVNKAQITQTQAIVILGGGSPDNSPEFGASALGSATLERVRFGAKLARESGLPVLVSAGSPYGSRPEAEAMQKVLAEEFRIPVKWVEGVSRDTAENALFSAAILKENGITRLTLVSHSSHLPRAVPLFEQQGLTVTAAPLDFSNRLRLSIDDFFPEGMGKSREALREYLGQLFNRIKDSLP